MDEERRPDEDTPRGSEPAGPIAWEHPEPAAEPSNGLLLSGPSDQAVPPPPGVPVRAGHALEPTPASLPPLEVPAIAPTFADNADDADDATDVHATDDHDIDVGDDEFESARFGPVDALAPAAAGNGDAALDDEDKDDEDTDKDKLDEDDDEDKADDDDTELADDEPLTAADRPDATRVAVVDDAWPDDEDEDEYDDEWDVEPATMRSTFFGTRAARVVTVLAVLTIAALLASTVLLWQQVESVKSDVSTVPAKPVGNAELTDLRRRLARLETQVAATTDDNGNLVGPTDELRAELASLRQCVANFQQALTSRTRTPVVIC